MKKRSTKIEWIEKIPKIFSGPETFVSPAQIHELKTTLISKKRLTLDIGPSALFIFNAQKRKILFMEDSIEQFTGYSSDEIMKMGLTEFVKEIIVDEHVIPISTLGQRMFLAYFKRDIIENASANLEHNYHPKNNKSETRRLLLVYTAAIWDAMDKPLINVGKIIDTTHLSKMGCPRLTIIKDNKIIHQEEAASQILSGKCDFGLTKKELEILACLSAGFTNQEIAAKLKTSIATVYTHRKNIKEKSKKSMPVLINEFRERGLIS